MASSSISFSESSFLDVNIKKYVPITLNYISCKPYNNYCCWKPLIIRVLKNFKIDGHITGRSVCPSPSPHLISSSGKKSSNPDYSSWREEDKVVISWIYATLSPSILEQIHGIDILENVHIPGVDILENILGVDFPGIDFPTERQIRRAIEQLSARQIWLGIELLFDEDEYRQLQPVFQLLRDSLRAIQHPVPDSDTQSMVDGSQLSPDLLRLIAKRLDSCFDFTHFRSVCPSWRSLDLPEPCLVPARFPLTSYDYQSIQSFYLSKRIIALFRFPKKPDRLVKIEEDKEGEGIMHLLNPLSNSRINGSELLDCMNTQVIELSRQYVVHYEAYDDHPLEPGYRGYTRKVAFMGSSTEENYYVLLVDHWHPKFAMLSSRDNQWTILKNTPQLCEDIISFNGKFYAIDKGGRTMVVEPSLNVSFLAIVDSGTKRQFLVESGGQLLLVQMFSNNFEMSMGRLQGCISSTMEKVWFKVCKLYEAGREWELVKRLGEHVLILGKDGAFSASASEFYWEKRNSIIFSLNNFDRNGAGDMLLCNYKDGSVEPLEYPPFDF